MSKRILRNSYGHLPVEFHQAHDLCFVLHDIMAMNLVAGEKSDVFRTSIEVAQEAEETVLDDVDALFALLEAEGRLEERAAIVLSTVFPAVLSDMLHCLYEALQASSKAKLNVTYMLLRKPLQESLYLLEMIVLSRIDFAHKLATTPLLLRASTAGGLQAHTKRIQQVLELIDEADGFDAAYIAQLRYMKCDDGFDGICNLALHLFTEHKSIATEPLNINFIFSGWEQKRTQWAFLYSRLPYLLSYMHRIVEYITKDFALTVPAYLDMVDRRVAALSILAWAQVDEHYKTERLQAHVAANHDWLVRHCISLGAREPTGTDFAHMAFNGALPGESWLIIKIRDLRFARQALNHRKQANRQAAE